MMFNRLWLCVGIVGAGFYAGFPLLQEALQLRQQTTSLRTERERLKQNMEELGDFSQGPAMTLDNAVQQLHEAMRVSAGSAGKPAIEIKGMAHAAAIADAAQASAWQGIRQVAVTISWPDVGGLDEILWALKSVERLNQVLDLDLQTVTQKNNQLRVELTVYGT